MATNKAFSIYGLLAFTAIPLYKALREHHQLLESPYPPSTGPGVGIVAIVGCIGFVWSFATWPCCGAAGHEECPWPMFLISALVDLSSFALLLASAILQAQSLPHPLVSCGKEATWKVPANHSSIYSVLGAADHPTQTAYDKCKEFRDIWVETIILLPILLLSATIGLVGGYKDWRRPRPGRVQGARIDRIRREQRRQEHHCWQCLRRKNTHQHRHWWEPEKVYYLRRLWSRLRTSNPPKRETHQELQDLFIRDNTNDITCVHSETTNTQTPCWTCGAQFCNECQPNTVTAPQPSTALHLTHCNPLCKKCFLSSLCHRRNAAPCTCAGPQIIRDILSHTTVQQRSICNKCYAAYGNTSTHPFDAGLHAPQIMAAKKELDERELLRLGLETRNCGDCADPLNDLEPRWWRCNRCFGECVDAVHPGVVYEGWV